MTADDAIDDEFVRALRPVLRKARRAAKLTQQAVAATTGISALAYNRIENGSRGFTYAWVGRLPPALRRPVIDAYEELAKRRLQTWAELRRRP